MTNEHQILFLLSIDFKSVEKKHIFSSDDKDV